MPGLKRILIADDHAIFREGLKLVIADIRDMTVSDEATNGAETLSKLRDNDYDILILDISMPGLDGFDILSAVKIMKPDMPVLVLSFYPEEECALRAFKLGASGYLTKGSPLKEFIDALQKVSEGNKYISDAMAQTLVTRLFNPPRKDIHECLSNREYQVMRMIASGKSTGKIADELMLSVKTISAHRANILKKLNLENSAKLTRFAVENKL